jgi:hypothetical protein
MKRAIARIKFLSSGEGGRTQPIPLMNFGCPVFFEGIPELSKHGYDCRVLVPEHGAEITPGETVEKLGMIFLYPEDVFPFARPGTKFSLWEGKTIAHGEILGLE